MGSIGFTHGDFSIIGSFAPTLCMSQAMEWFRVWKWQKSASLLADAMRSNEDLGKMKKFHQMSPGWWQLKDFWNFHPEIWGRWTQFDEHIFKGVDVQPPTMSLFFPSLVLWLGDSNFSASYRLWDPSVIFSLFTVLNRCGWVLLVPAGQRWHHNLLHAGLLQEEGQQWGCVDNDSWSLEFWAKRCSKTKVQSYLLLFLRLRLKVVEGYHWGSNEKEIRASTISWNHLFFCVSYQLQHGRIQLSIAFLGPGQSTDLPLDPAPQDTPTDGAPPTTLPAVPSESSEGPSPCHFGMNRNISKMFASIIYVYHLIR